MKEVSVAGNLHGLLNIHSHSPSSHLCSRDWKSYLLTFSSFIGAQEGHMTQNL